MHAPSLSFHSYIILHSYFEQGGSFLILGINWSTRESSQPLHTCVYIHVNYKLKKVHT